MMIIRRDSVFIVIGDASRCDRLVSGHYLLAVSAEDFSSRDKELWGVFGEVLAECFISYRQKF